MDLFEDGFLNLKLDPDDPSVKAIHYSTLSTVLMLQIIVGIVSFIKMRRQVDGSKILNGLFIFCVCCACTHAVEGFLLYHDVLVVEIIGTISHGLFFVTILGTLIIRLHITFNDSVYGMSSTLIYVFTVILVVGCVMWIVYTILYALMGSTIPILSMGYSCFFLYFIASFLAVHFFVSNLKRVAMDQQTTIRSSDADVKNIKLKPQQQTLSDLTAKYMMLFAMAITTCILSQILGLFLNLESGLRHPIQSLDLLINLCCIYLQFAFAKEDYRRCCGCCDQKCRNYRSRRTKKAIHRESTTILETRTKDHIAITAIPDTA